MKKIINAIYELITAVGQASQAAYLARQGNYKEARLLMMRR